ncbi:MAG TPA: hypothetical protein VF493_12775, partial [Terriglobales bacterium]
EGCKGLSGFAYIEKVRDRRFPLIDEERGLVWALAVFDIPGGTYPTQVDGKTQQVKREPRSILIGDLFKLDAGQIQSRGRCGLLHPLSLLADRSFGRSRKNRKPVFRARPLYRNFFRQRKRLP